MPSTDKRAKTLYAQIEASADFVRDIDTKTLDALLDDAATRAFPTPGPRLTPWVLVGMEPTGREGVSLYRYGCDAVSL